METKSITLYLLVVLFIICTTTILYIMWAETNFYFFSPYYSYFISFLYHIQNTYKYFATQKLININQRAQQNKRRIPNTNIVYT